MQQVKQLAPFLAGWAVLLASESFAEVGLTNGLLQIGLFICVVCIPTWRTERMSYVDMGWPWGLVGIGLVTLGLGEGDGLRVLMVSGLYILIGGRMGILAVKMWRVGALDRELSRYRYQVLRWERRGEANWPLARQAEVLKAWRMRRTWLSRR